MPVRYRQGQSALVLAGPLSGRLFHNLRATTLIIADPNLDNAETLEIMARAASLDVSTYIVSRDYLEPGYWLEYSEIDGMMLASLWPQSSSAASAIVPSARLTLCLLSPRSCCWQYRVLWRRC